MVLLVLSVTVERSRSSAVNGRIDVGSGSFLFPKIGTNTGLRTQCQNQITSTRGVKNPAITRVFVP